MQSRERTNIRRSSTMKNLDNNQVKWSDKHPIGHALVVTAISILAIAVASMIIQVIAGIIVMAQRGNLTREGFGNLGIASTVIKMIGYIIILLIFWFKFRKELNGFFSVKGLGIGILLCWSELAVNAFLLINGIIEHQAYGNFVMALIQGAQPGISEEILYRIIPLSIVMRSSKRDQLVVPAAIFTSVIFGLSHGLNIFAGADPVTTMFQVTYSICVGLLFAAVYLRTGNLWISIIMHTLTDVICSLSASIQSDNGVLTQNYGFVGAIFQLTCAALYLINALYIFRRSKRVGIPDKWADKWNVKEEQ